jgi:hypothetical protein
MSLSSSECGYHIAKGKQRLIDALRFLKVYFVGTAISYALGTGKIYDTYPRGNAFSWVSLQFPCHSELKDSMAATRCLILLRLSINQIRSC